MMLSQNPYPGRGIILGVDSTGKNLVQIYWLMGRSVGSRNRILHSNGDGDSIFTSVADLGKEKGDPFLTLYEAMGQYAYTHVVSNGHQTTSIIKALCKEQGFNNALLDYSYEPDKPNFTPRITGISCWYVRIPMTLSIIRKDPFGVTAQRALYQYEELTPSIGHCITTYKEDGDPLPSFEGEPFLMSLNGDINAIAEEYWDMLNKENRVALVVKFIPRGKEIFSSSYVIKNQYEQIK